MKRSSAAQFEFALNQERESFAEEVAPRGSAANSEPSYEGESSGPLTAPAFESWGGDVAAIAARRAGRLSAAKVTDQELRELLRERQYLLDKQFAKNITKHEKHRLQYVRWSLDRIEDARVGMDLDRLESVIVHYERFSEDISKLRHTLDETLARRRK